MSCVQFMVERQEQAQEYHQSRFGDMDPVPFVSTPEVERPALFIRGKTRTDW